MEPKRGWVEVYRGTDEEEYQKLERAARGAAIRYRVVETSKPGKTSPIALRTTGYTAPAYRGSPSNYNTIVAVYSDLGEPVYSLLVRKRDAEKFNALRAGL